jgi:hypothetical protein
MTDAPLQSAQPDEIDRVLRAYFQRRTPRVWPPAPSPDAGPSIRKLPRRRGGALVGLRSRLALVAAIALIVLGAFLASGKFVAPPANGDTPININDTTSRKPSLGDDLKGRSIPSRDKDGTAKQDTQRKNAR